MLSKDVFKKLVQPLEDAFNTKLPRVRLIALYDVLQGKEEKHLAGAVKYLINNKPYMPINADIIIATNVEAEKDWSAKKAMERKQSEEFFDPNKKRGGLARDSVICVNNMMDAKTADEKVALMIDMDRRYPGIGYKEEAEVLKRTLTAKSHNLSHERE